MRASQIILAVGCIALGLCAPAILGVLQPIVALASPAGPSLIGAWTLPLGSATLVLLLTAAAAAAWLARARSTDPPRVYITWECGFGNLGPRVQATSVSFAQPVVRMFGTLFNYAQTMRLEGLDARLFPLEITAESTVDHPLEHHVYGPMVHWFGRLSDKIINLQQGSIHRYLWTMLLTLALLLAIGGYLK